MSNGTFPAKIPSEKTLIFFLSISAFELIFFGFLSEGLQPGCWSYNLRILYNFLGKIHCFETIMFFFITVGVPAENFGLFAKIFGPFCENCFRRVQQKNLRKTVFITFGVRAKSFLTVDGKLSAVLSKLLSTSLEENFAWLFFCIVTS